MPSFAHLLDRLREVVASMPEAIAVLERGEFAWTYAQLWEESARLGEALGRLGIGRERVVGLALEKSAGWLVGALGTWWAGAAYLPLDPGWPPDRLASIARESGMAAVVAGPGLSAFFDGLGVPILEPSRITGEPMACPALSVADDLAYLIYTSGSVGRPKGVLVTHRGIVPLIDAQVPAFGLRAGCRVLWLLSPVFDASLSDVGTALLSGSTICIEDPAATATVDGLIGALKGRGITHVDLPPSLLRILDPSAIPGSVETLIIGGEPSPPEVVRRWASRFRVVNVYGPTEATVCTSLCSCRADEWDQPLLGDPITGVGYHVFNPEGEPVEAGIPGELWISGPGLARGYLDQPGLTAEKFLDRRGDRYYRTGDRVVIRGDGAYVFLGRFDRQVKVRGLLIEPEEVEARLLEHPEVVRAAVVKRPLASTGRPGSSREGLVAFVEARGPARPPDLRGWLARSLPRWMIPQRVVFLEELPRLESGKVDLSGLVGLPIEGAEPTPGVPEWGSTAEALAAIWREVLGRDDVGMSGGFFEQGGDSLGLLEAVAAAQVRGLVLPPALLAEGRTIPEIARWLDERPDPTRENDDEPAPGVLRADSLRLDAESDPDWPAVLARSRARPGQSLERPPRSIFLTGATGHLGSRLLGELLARTGARFHLLVRATDEARGLDRVMAGLRDHGFGLDDPGRVRIVLGDVGKPRLGMAAGVWGRLAGDVDAIFHNAARVNLVLPYESLRAANLLGTREVVRLQATGRRKRLHHASTLSVFVATDRNRGVLLEGDDLSSTRWVHGGYAQTKWAAEWLIRAARGSAGPSMVYRLGLITGDSVTGRSAPGDFLALFVRGLARLGSVPRLEVDLRLDVTPVDFAASAMAHLALQQTGWQTPPPSPPSDPLPRKGGGSGEVRPRTESTASNLDEPATFHLANPPGLSLLELVDALRQTGLPLEEVPADAWRSRIESRGALEPESAAAVLALCRALPGCGPSFASYRSMDLFQATGVEFDMSATIAGLEGSGIVGPPSGRELLGRYLANWGPLP